MPQRQTKLALAPAIAAAIASLAPIPPARADVEHPNRDQPSHRISEGATPGSNLFLSRAGLVFDAEVAHDVGRFAWSSHWNGALQEIEPFSTGFARIDVDDHVLVAPSVADAGPRVRSEAPMIDDLAAFQFQSGDQTRSSAPLMQWRPPIDDDERWSVNLGSTPGVPSNVKGLALSYEASNQLSFSSGIGLSGELGDYRRSDDFVGRREIESGRSLPLVAGVDWSPRPGLRVSGYAGTSFLRDVEFFDRRGDALAEFDLDRRPVLGFDLSLSF